MNDKRMTLVEILMAAVVLGDREATELAKEILSAAKLVDLTDAQVDCLARLRHQHLTHGL